MNISQTSLWLFCVLFFGTILYAELQPMDTGTVSTEAVIVVDTQSPQIDSLTELFNKQRGRFGDELLKRLLESLTLESLTQISTSSVSAVPQSVDPLLELFDKQRKQFGDELLRRQLESISSNTETAYTTSPIIYAVILGGLMLILILVVIFRRPQKQSVQKDIEGCQTGQPPVRDNGSINLPLGIFGTQWYGRADTEKLEEWITKTKTVILENFFDVLGTKTTPPDAETLRKAQASLAKELNRAITSNEIYETLNGNKKLSIKESNFLTHHLNELMPLIHIPQPAIFQGEVRYTIIGVVASLGALGGFCCGRILSNNILSKILGMFSTETGTLLGTIAGAFLAIILYGFFSTYTGYKRVWWSFLLFPLLVPLRKVFDFFRKTKQFNRIHYRNEIESFINSWFRSTLPVLVVLMFHSDSNITGEPPVVDSKILVKLVPIAKRIQQEKGEGLEIAIAALVQEFENLGFEMSVPNKPVDLRWNESMREEYDVFGLIQEGDKIQIMKDPTKQNNKIQEKGLVKRI